MLLKDWNKVVPNGLGFKLLSKKGGTCKFLIRENGTLENLLKEIKDRGFTVGNVAKEKLQDNKKDKTVMIKVS
jgi:hypothetical protein